MRGIGYVTQHIINHLPKDRLAETELVLFYSEDLALNISETLSNLDLEGIKHSSRKMLSSRKSIFEKTLPGRLSLIPKAFMKFQTYFQYLYGTKSFGRTKDIDVFVQFDQSAPLPRSINKNGKLLLVIYDIIPFKLEADYLWNYRTARTRGLNRRASIKCYIRRLLYKHHLRANTTHAHKLISISSATTADFIQDIGVKSEKIESLTLGASNKQAQNHQSSDDSVVVARYHQTSWGYLPLNYTLESTDKFLLFVGGADYRRKLEDLVTAYNQLRARGEDIQLVLAGDSMQGPNDISNHIVRQSLLQTAYPDDIVYVGFTDDTTRDWLYQHATAFIFPSVYEGFGLPVLEAMNYGTPVISYDNRATKEVAKDGPLYANDSSSLLSQIYQILKMSPKRRKDLLEHSISIAGRYTWSSAGKKFMNIIES